MSAPVVIAGFPITSDVSLKRWGEHMDIDYEIVNHGRRQRNEFDDEPKGTWCYYVHISEKALSPEHFAEFWLTPANESRTRSDGWPELTYAYYGAKFAEAEWHGGVTFYEKRGGLDGNCRRVNIGCDFAHYWDEGRFYTFADVEHEAKRTIDQLRAMYPFKRRCVYTGIWLPEDQMIVGERGRLYSPEGKAKSDAYKAERATGSAS